MRPSEVRLRGFPLTSPLFPLRMQWVIEQTKDDPEFFNRMAQGQAPKFLWIGADPTHVPMPPWGSKASFGPIAVFGAVYTTPLHPPQPPPLALLPMLTTAPALARLQAAPMPVFPPMKSSAVALASFSSTATLLTWWSTTITASRASSSMPSSTSRSDLAPSHEPRSVALRSTGCVCRQHIVCPMSVCLSVCLCAT